MSQYNFNNEFAAFSDFILREIESDLIFVFLKGTIAETKGGNLYLNTEFLTLQVTLEKSVIAAVRIYMINFRWSKK